MYLMHERDLQAHPYAATCMYRDDVELNSCLQYHRSRDYLKRHRWRVWRQHHHYDDMSIPC